MYPVTRLDLIIYTIYTIMEALKPRRDLGAERNGFHANGMSNACLESLMAARAQRKSIQEKKAALQETYRDRLSRVGLRLPV